MKKAIGIVFCLFLANTCQAQWMRPWGYSPHIDPRADRIAAISRAHMNYAYASRISQQSLRLYLENRQLRINQFRYNQDVNRQRKLNNIKHNAEVQAEYLKAKQLRLQNLKFAHQLKVEEQNMRIDGILPPRKEPKIVIMGKEYKSFEEFKASSEFSRFKEIRRELNK